ncbi:hypothetical protein [uncultured Rhodoblastus sp.]|uniref:hypothetical protein n=1 Tax=uncultured Rhodoblastus sp. TaxID=543037 RepID=UPI0025CBADE1|nr:hypothetical protein [uncultured Rhodoblastus sp.]
MTAFRTAALFAAALFALSPKASAVEVQRLAAVRTYNPGGPGQIGGGGHAFGPSSSPTTIDGNWVYRIKIPSFFTGYAAQSIGAPSGTQPSDGVYVAHPAWSVAGVDYDVGIPLGADATLKVPGVDTLPARSHEMSTPLLLRLRG